MCQQIKYTNRVWEYNIECIYFLSLDVHLQMLASEKVGLVRRPWAVRHPRHQRTDKAKGNDACIVLLLCLLDKFPGLYIHLWHGEYVDAIYSTWFAARKKYQQVWARRQTWCMFHRPRGVVGKLWLHSSSKVCVYLWHTTIHFSFLVQKMSSGLELLHPKYCQ